MVEAKCETCENRKGPGFRCPTLEHELGLDDGTSPRWLYPHDGFGCILYKRHTRGTKDGL